MVLRESDKFSRHQKYPDTRQDAVAVHCSVGLARRTSLFVQFPNVKDPTRTNLLSLFFLFLFAILRTTKQPRSSLALVAGCQKSLWYEFGQKHTARAVGRVGILALLLLLVENRS